MIVAFVILAPSDDCCLVGETQVNIPCGISVFVESYFIYLPTDFVKKIGFFL